MTRSISVRWLLWFWFSKHDSRDWFRAKHKNSRKHQVKRAEHGIGLLRM
jgi:hypothetical protein